MSLSEAHPSRQLPPTGSLLVPEHRYDPAIYGHAGIDTQPARSPPMAPPPASSRQEISATQKMISATWGSIFTSLLVTPLDVVRVRMQSQDTTSARGSFPKFSSYTTSFKPLPSNLGVTACCREVFWGPANGQMCMAVAPGTMSAVDCAVENQKRVFTSTWDGLRKIARYEGPRSLWRGLSPTLLMAIPGNVIYFTGYEWLRFNHASPIRRVTNDTYGPLLAGSVARVAAAVVISPVEMLRTRMQATQGNASGVFKSTLARLHQVTQAQGYTALWRGLTLTMWRDVPFSGLYWWGYEATRNALHDARAMAQGDSTNLHRSLTSPRSQWSDKSADVFVDSFIAGATSGAVAALVTTPFDVGKTRQQVLKYSGDEASRGEASTKTSSPATTAKKMQAAQRPEQLSMPRFLAHIFQQDGLTGLFRGWSARCMKVAPACAIMISSYEVGKRWTASMNERLDAATALPAAELSQPE